MDIAWNCNGSTLAVAYGDPNQRKWWQLQSSVGIWGIFRRDLQENAPSTSIEVTVGILNFSFVIQGSVTSLAFHPKNPVILAGGTSSGKILIWNIFEQEPLQASTIIDEYFHR